MYKFAVAHSSREKHFRSFSIIFELLRFFFDGKISISTLPDNFLKYVVRHFAKKTKKLGGGGGDFHLNNTPPPPPAFTATCESRITFPLVDTSL